MVEVFEAVALRKLGARCSPCMNFGIKLKCKCGAGLARKGWSTDYRYVHGLDGGLYMVVTRYKCRQKCECDTNADSFSKQCGLTHDLMTMVCPVP